MQRVTGRFIAACSDLYCTSGWATLGCRSPGSPLNQIDSVIQGQAANKRNKENTARPLQRGVALDLHQLGSGKSKGKAVPTLFYFPVTKANLVDIEEAC